jgi:hypothetical protein
MYVMPVGGGDVRVVYTIYTILLAVALRTLGNRNDADWESHVSSVRNVPDQDDRDVPST